MFTLIAIDPGNDAGWAVWVLSTADRGPVARLGACGLGRVPADLWLGDVAILVEVPQVYGDGAVPPKDLVTLAMNAGRHVEAVRTARRAQELPEPPSYGVHPARWKGTLKKDVHHAQLRKAMAPADMRIVDTRIAAYPMGKRHNVLDAVALGFWAMERVVAMHSNGRGVWYVLRASSDYVFESL